MVEGEDKDIFEQVLKEVHPHVQGQKRGVLYTVITIIHREDKEKTQTICRCLGINENDHKKQDLKKLDKILIEKIENYHPIVSKNKGFRQQLGDNVKKMKAKIGIKTGDNEMIETKWIIIGASMLVGVGVCIKYLDDVKQEKQGRERRLAQSERQQQYSPPPPPIPASLCLVVPARIASTLETNSGLLNASFVADILEDTVYFLSTTPKKANSSEQYLKLTDEEILPDSQREVYIRINVSEGGRNLIDKTTRYGLKSNLPDNAKFTLEKLACLKDLSGLEKFNRV
ncbi:hypothetical protein [Okeania sp. SIO2B3]|uniref:hypothetical protein n=1 Tax=Okeania sp. SIO2B3 TaxID=2607784 RepID=UPI0013C0D317|nr:hypothetical protein [Okeania sp. SIO2B3]NET44292.1 hypothetical protein [Okeania sp. SIO2B3]